MFEVHGNMIEDGSLIMTYASFEDPDAFGKELTFTCVTQTSVLQDYSELHEIRNYYGDLSFQSAFYGTYD